MMSNYIKAKRDIANFPKWKLQISTKLRRQTSSDISGHSYIDNDKNSKKTSSNPCICTRRAVHTL